jgi:hypothetical protein
MPSKKNIYRNKKFSNKNRKRNLSRKKNVSKKNKNKKSKRKYNMKGGAKGDMALNYLKEFLKKLKFDSPEYFTNLGTKLETITPITPITPIDTIKKKFNCNRWCKSVKISSLLYELSSLCFKKEYKVEKIMWDKEDIEAEVIKSFIKIAYDVVVKEEEEEEEEEEVVFADFGIDVTVSITHNTEDISFNINFVNDIFKDKWEENDPDRKAKYTHEGPANSPGTKKTLIRSEQKVGTIKPSKYYSHGFPYTIKSNDINLKKYFEEGTYQLYFTDEFRTELIKLDRGTFLCEDTSVQDTHEHKNLKARNYRIVSELAGGGEYYNPPKCIGWEFFDLGRFNVELFTTNLENDNTMINKTGKGIKGIKIIN